MRRCILIVALMLLTGCGGSVLSDLLDGKDTRKKAGTVKIDASDTTLNMFVGENRELLLQYLTSSAEWKVVRFGETPVIEGTIVALKRKKTADGFQTTLHGYQADFTASILIQSRVMLRLEPYKPGSEDGWIRRELFDGGRIGESINLNLYEPEYDQPGIESYLVLEGSGVWLEVYEQANSSDRDFTLTTVNDINKELNRLLQKGFSPSLLPEGSMKISDSLEIFVEDGMQPGIYNVHGYVNPGEPGWIYFKVINTETGNEVMYEMEQKRTIEYVGWSDKPDEKFFFNCEAWCKEGDWEHEYPARFELWFAPQDGEKEKLLGTNERNIYGWER